MTLMAIIFAFLFCANPKGLIKWEAVPVSVERICSEKRITLGLRIGIYNYGKGVLIETVSPSGKESEEKYGRPFIGVHTDSLIVKGYSSIGAMVSASATPFGFDAYIPSQNVVRYLIRVEMPVQVDSISKISIEYRHNSAKTIVNAFDFPERKDYSGAFLPISISGLKIAGCP